MMRAICITLPVQYRVATVGRLQPLASTAPFHVRGVLRKRPYSVLGCDAALKPSAVLQLGIGVTDLHSCTREEKVEAVKAFVKEVGECEVEVVEGGGGGDSFSGGSGGSGGGGGDDQNKPEEGGDEEKKAKKMLMSQKLSLAYGALLAVGGIIGYAKSNSTKSLLSGTLSGLALYYVSSQLPTNPVYASSLGLGISSLLLVVMGMRFKKSGKLFPAGVVSVVSLIMTGGYLHGIIRSTHHA